MKNIRFENPMLTRELFGHHNYNLDKICKAFNVEINTRGSSLMVNGTAHNTDLAEKILQQLYQLLENKFSFDEADFDAAIKTIKHNNNSHIKDIFSTTIFKTVRNKPITPRNLAQKEYAEAILKNDILFAIGPAGTGKTYLAMAMAMAAFSRGEIKKIILARPAVEAGETLGFLPGDLAQKINPYLRPLYDALYDMMDYEKVQTFI